MVSSPPHNEISDEPIVLVSVVDKHLALMQAALIQSIQYNFKDEYQIEYYIISDQLSDGIKRKIEYGVNKDIIRIKWLDINDVLYSHVKLHDDKSLFPINVYARLFAPFFLPKEYTKALYLDVDMICNADIADLWKIDLGNAPVAGVIDRCKTVNCGWAGIKNYKELGLSPDTEYYNSGMFIMNIPEWRRTDATYNIIRTIERNKEYASFPINYGMNVVFANKWHKLDKRWNTYATDEEDDPYIIHFVNRKPIYKSYKFNEKYKELFFKYLGMTAWKNFRPIGEFHRLGKKILVVAEKKIKTWRWK